MKFLDEVGLSTVWQNIEERLEKKESKIPIIDFNNTNRLKHSDLEIGAKCINVRIEGETKSFDMILLSLSERNDTNALRIGVGAGIDFESPLYNSILKLYKVQYFGGEILVDKFEEFVATAEANGLMSAKDKVKVDTIDSLAERIAALEAKLIQNV